MWDLIDGSFYNCNTKRCVEIGGQGQGAGTTPAFDRMLWATGLWVLDSASWFVVIVNILNTGCNGKEHGI